MRIRTYMGLIAAGSIIALPVASLAQDQGRQPASATTRAVNAAAAAEIDADAEREAQEDQFALSGLIAQIPGGIIRNAAGDVVLDRGQFAFLDQEAAPDTVNPRLWRQARRNALHGLFEVVPGAIWQVRGYDISVMTIIRTDNGIVIVDPLTVEEASRAGLALFRQFVGNWPVKAVIFTHSHIDHFGGIGGVIEPADSANGGVRIIAPHGFTEEAVSENVLAGPAMLARAEFMFAPRLDAGPRAHVDTGLGPRIGNGVSGFMQPTDIVGPEGATLTIDGLEFVFSDAAGTEAPAEFTFYLPRYRALHSTEVVSKTFHNLLTLRGAQVRDALHWSQVIDGMIQRWTTDEVRGAEVRLASHGWPTFGPDNVRAELARHRDMYRLVHDRTLAAANRGATIQELPELVESAAGLHPDPTARGYYGTINHNAKAVYQRYFGWWDGVPANFDPLPPEEAARGYVELAGGPRRLLAAGRRAHAAGNDRWAATLLNHLVFADPDNVAAKAALADVYEQLGYQAESGAWRNYYLVAAARLRGTGESAAAQRSGTVSESFVAAIPTLALFNAMATRYAPAAPLAQPQIFRFIFPDTNERVMVEASGIVENPRMELLDPGQEPAPATAEIRVSRRAFSGLISGRVPIMQLVAAGQIQLSGDLAALQHWFAAHSQNNEPITIVTP